MHQLYFDTQEDENRYRILWGLEEKTIPEENQVNILDISQTILQDFFTMMMIVDVTNHQDLEALQKQLWQA